MVTTEEKSAVHTQKIKINELKHTTTKTHQITKEDAKEKEKNKKLQNRQKTINNGQRESV